MSAQLAREMPDADRGAVRPAGDRATLLGFVADEASEAALRGGLPGLFGEAQLRRGDVRTATRALEREPTPGILLIDIAGVADPVRALEALAAVCTPDVQVLVIGDQADIALYRRLTRELGVAEYLHKPLTRDMVARLFGPHLAGQASAAEATGRGSQVVAVCGARGGCGATTVAVNLAVQLSEASRGHVALLDLHLRGGTAGLMLGVRPGTGLRVALEQPDRVDALFLERAGIPIDDRLRLVAAEEPMDSLPQPAEVGVQRVLEMLRQRFNFIVVDLPMPPGPAERAVLAAARHCVLVLGPDIAGIRDTLALRKLLGTSGSSRATIVLNRAGLPGSLKPKLIEEGLGAPPDVTIPDLPRHLPRAANLGRPASRETPALRRAMAPLLQEIATVPVAGAKASLLGRLFGRGRA
ncbi:pilus assembly protein CpaE [Siccirubricoccus deserti]|uniref:P-loop NTPase n=1 Tax=Siccirubricoccus deserti TaxID=2013562 RepID=A0A9X0UDK8_9PROT|nr:P-loop NTPase [Siccirubricoccus deserti]MBC4016659.1 P-loop NTPase [Siccirubricoccus deserti]GGC50884.1 pilus assembly protein CpaE [Siccirubricoccus deserti]